MPDVPAIATIETAVLAGLLLPVAVIDWRRGIIPDWLNGAIAATGLLRLLGFGMEAVAVAVAEAMLAGGLVYALRWSYHRWRGFHGLGLGDVKLVAAATLWIGLAALPTAMLAASVSGLVLVFALRLAGLGLTPTTRIAFGPHLALGVAVAWLYGPLGWE